MPYNDKVAENKMVAEKCLHLKAYNAGVTRAYYAAFQHIKAYLIGTNFDYDSFLKKTNSTVERVYSHGTMQAAITTCLQAHGKNLTDIYKIRVLGNLYEKRRKADYDNGNIVEAELKDSLKDLYTVLTVVS